MRGIMRAITALSAVLIAVIPMAGASAQTPATLVVSAVTGRTVSLELTLDPTMPVTADLPTHGTVEVAGAVLPASTSLNVAPEARPSVAILVLDASGSMAGARMAAARKAASTFLAAMPSEVQISVVTFNDRVRTGELTRDHEAVRRALAGASPTGDTRMYDAIVRAVDLIPRGCQARIVLLSDGKDTLSAQGITAVEQSLRTAAIPVDVVAISPSADERAILGRIATASGGTVRTAKSAVELVNAFASASTSFGSRVRITATIPERLDARGQRITATVAIGSMVAEGTTQLPPADSLAAVSSPAQPIPAQVDAVPESNLLTVILPAILAGLVMICLVAAAAVIWATRERERRLHRVQQVMRYQTGSQRTSAMLARELAEPPMRFARVNRLLARIPITRRTAMQLSAAGYALTPADWLLIRAGVGIVVAVLVGLFLRSAPLGIVIGVLLAWLGPWMFLRARVARRQRAFADALPDFLMILASSLRAGLSFTHALESASEGDTGEVGLQLRRAMREVQVGASLDRALMDCADRMDNEDLRWTVTALTVQREVGGNLSNILDGAAATIKARYELRREVRTLSAEGRLSAYILVALPLGVFAFLAIFRREYISLLWTDPIGIVMLVGLAVAMLVGWVWMRSIARIKV